MQTAFALPDRSKVLCVSYVYELVCSPYSLAIQGILKAR
jgi:hypothetical protein